MYYRKIDKDNLQGGNTNSPGAYENEKMSKDSRLHYTFAFKQRWHVFTYQFSKDLRNTFFFFSKCSYI